MNIDIKWDGIVLHTYSVEIIMPNYFTSWTILLIKTIFKTNFWLSNLWYDILRRL